MDCKDRILSEDYLSLILDYPFLSEVLDASGIDYCYVPVSQNLGILYLDRRGLPAVSVANFSYRYTPQLYGLGAFADRESGGFYAQPLLESGILDIQNPPLSLTGAGVIIGVIDTGISYEAPVFRYSDGSSRILAVWDQTDQSGEPPDGYLYGTLYSQEEINAALRQEDARKAVPVTDEIGHGTALTAAAAGSRLEEGTSYVGAAPDAQLVIVKVKPAKQYLREYYLTADDVPAYSTDDLLMAVRFLQSFSVPFEQPVVILMGLGTSLGSHTQDSLFSEYLQEAARAYGQVLVLSGGNEGNSAGHFRAPLTAQQQLAEIRVGENTKGFLAEIWGMNPAIFRIGVRSPGGEQVEEVDFRLGKRITYTFIYEKTRLEIDHVPMERNTGDQLVVLRLTDPSPGIWTIQVRGLRTLPDSMFDIWLTQPQFVQGEVFFLKAEPQITLTMPSFVQDAVTVTAYDSQSGSFYFNSGQGPSRTGQQKPDLAAPGVRISTPDGSYTGTAMAAALTAGAAAQLLQWTVVEKNQTYLSSREVVGYLTAGASPVETAQGYPDSRWGYGKLDMEGTFDVIAGRI